jgi:hypothetical protein
MTGGRFSSGILFPVDTNKHDPLHKAVNLDFINSQDNDALLQVSVTGHCGQTNLAGIDNTDSFHATPD